MDSSLKNTHVKLLAFDLLSLKQIQSFASSDPISFNRRWYSLSRAEVLGIVTFHEHKPGRLLEFAIDDGTGCIPCVLWLNQLNSPHLSRHGPENDQLNAATAKNFASLIQIGLVARVRGQITRFRGSVQIKVADVVIERDPNVETLHWLQCVKLARKHYDVAPHVVKSHCRSR